jgi:hypothetical protein
MIWTLCFAVLTTVAIVNIVRIVLRLLKGPRLLTAPPSLEETLAHEVIEAILQQGIQRRQAGWAPALSRHVRRQHSKIREEHHINWQKMKFDCERRGLNYDELAKHVKRLAKEYKILVR